VPPGVNLLNAAFWSRLNLASALVYTHKITLIPL